VQLGHGETDAKKNRKPVACGKCGAEGHSARTCPNPLSEKPE
jgi:hypothetical protein